jgi:hypothetical protein
MPVRSASSEITVTSTLQEDSEPLRIHRYTMRVRNAADFATRCSALKNVSSVSNSCSSLKKAQDPAHPTFVVVQRNTAKLYRYVKNYEVYTTEKSMCSLRFNN